MNKAKQAGLVLAAILLLTGCGEASVNERVAEEIIQETSPVAVQEPVIETPVPEIDIPEGTIDSKENGKPQRGGNKGGLSMDPDNDAEAQVVINECAAKFDQYTFLDPVTGFELEYSLYIPETFDNDTNYPLILFMPDSTGTGRTAANLVEHYFGADVWASERDQEKHPSFVLVPAFTEAIADDNWETSDQLVTCVKLIRWLIEEYHLDASKLYTTGQSGGCMASLYLSTVEPELFAASMYVGGQWDINVLDYLTDHSFVYITAGGDEKATGGQTEVIEMLDEEGIKYSYGEWSAQLNGETQIANAQALFDEGNHANFIRFETGTVAPGSSGFAAEHMASFNFAYKLSSARDWLFQQSN